MNQVENAVVAGLVTAGTLVLIALGLVLIFRATHTFNFAHGQMMLFPAYLVGMWQASGNFSGMVLLGQIVVAIVITALVGGLVYQLVLRRTVGQQPFIPIIATLGLASVADGAMAIMFGAQTFLIDIPGMPEGVVHILSVPVRWQTALLTAGSILLAIAVAVYMKYTDAGKRVRAAGQDALLASKVGINVRVVFFASWAAAGALAAIAGISFGSSNVVSTPMVGLALLTFPAILLGGMDSIVGALAGSLIVGMIQGFTITYWDAGMVNVVTYSMLLLLLMWRPQGLFGTVGVSKL